MDNYLNSSEIDLVCALQEEDEVSSNKIQASAIALTAGVKKAFVDTKAKPIITYLTAVIPSLLHNAFGVDYKKSIEKKLMGTQSLYNNLLNPFIESLKGLELSNIDSLSTVLSFHHYPFGPEEWDILTSFLHKARPKFKKTFTVDGWKYFLVLQNILEEHEKEETLDEKNLEFLQKKAMRIPDKLLAQYIHSLNAGSDENPTEALKAAQKSQVEITKAYFKKSNPSATEMQKLQKNSPEKYKEWRKSLTATKLAAKAVIESVFNEKGYNIVDVSIARKILKDNNIPDPIDKNFVGKVGLGTTKSMLFSFYTKYGKPLDCVVGANVTMNPKYTKEDNTYYCTHMPFISKTGKPVKVYSLEHRSNSSQKLHNAARSCLDVLEDVRTTLSTAIKPLLNNKMDRTNSTRALSALVLRVIDETAGRIGNAGSERSDNNTYGIHNLLVKHFRETKKGYTVSYVGKKGIPQKHSIEDKASVKAIKNLLKDRIKTAYVFSLDGNRPISPTSVGDYLDTTGFPGTPHMFRKIWANRIFNDVAFKLLKKFNPTGKIKEDKKNVTELWKQAIAAVAHKLGQTELGTPIRSYIDPVLMKKFWDKAGFDMPKPVQKVYDKMNEQNPNSEDD